MTLRQTSRGTGSRMKVILTLGVSVLALTAWAQTPLRRAASFAGLTAADYIEIRHLVSRYAFAVDSGADNGLVYASLFAPDGAFADRTGP